jgi:flagellar protein FliS
VYSPSRVAANAYANVGLETDIIAASPQQLIVLLYQGTEQAVRMALRHMADGDLHKKAAAISKASSILTEGLRAALDPTQGGELAAQLDALYVYMNTRLLQGHSLNQSAPLLETLGLLIELREAWQKIASVARTPTHSIAA